MTAEPPTPRGGIFTRILKSKIFKIGVGTCAALFVGLQFVPIDGVGENGTAKYQIDAPPEVNRILHESCYDCHSNEVRWPWYSKMFPVSWVVVRDVKEGRKALNFSEWGDLDEEDRAFEKENVWDVIDEGTMPLWFYVPAHPEAAITDEEKAILKPWLLAAADEDEDEDEDEDGDDKEASDGGKAADGNDEGNGGAKGAIAEAEEEKDDGEKEGEDEGTVQKKSAGGESANKPAPAPKSPAAKPKTGADTKAPAPAPAKGSAPKPEPKKEATYTGDKPCLAKSFKFGSVKSACNKGGQPQAKAMMKTLVKRGKDKGQNFKCTSCHSNQKTYDNKPNAVADLRKLLSAINK